MRMGPYLNFVRFCCSFMCFAWSQDIFELFLLEGRQREQPSRLVQSGSSARCLPAVCWMVSCGVVEVNFRKPCGAQNSATRTR